MKNSSTLKIAIHIHVKWKNMKNKIIILIIKLTAIRFEWRHKFQIDTGIVWFFFLSPSATFKNLYPIFVPWRHTVRRIWSSSIFVPYSLFLSFTFHLFWKLFDVTIYLLENLFLLLLDFFFGGEVIVVSLEAFGASL